MTGLPEFPEPTRRRGLTLTAASLSAALLIGAPVAAAATVTEQDQDAADDQHTEQLSSADDAGSGEQGSDDSAQQTETPVEAELTEETAEDADNVAEDLDTVTPGVDDSGAEDPAAEGPSAEDPELSAEQEADDAAEEALLETAETAEESSDSIVKLQIISDNDFHGRLERSGDVAGVEIMACTVDYFREQNPNTLFVGAGDHIGASTFTSWATDDEAAIEALNLMGLDITSVGNHEFDRGWADLRDRVMPLSDFPWLAANAVDAATGDPIVDPYQVLDIGGVRIAFIGLNTTDMPRLVSPDGIAGIEWHDLDTTANYWAEHIAENDEADLTIVLVHDGIAGTELSHAGGQFGNLVNNAHEDIDAIISGHTHREYALQTESGMWVTQTGEYTRNIGQMVIQYDTAADEIVSSEAQILPLISADDEPIYCNEGDRPDLAALVADAQQTAEEIGNVVIGSVEPGFARAQNAESTENRSARSTLSDLIADAQAWAARQSSNEVDFALMNPGGVRADLPPGSDGAGGEITYRDLATIQPFGNLINSVEITGAGIKEALELQWREGRDLMLGTSAEFRYSYDPQAPEGDRITGMWLNGEPLDLEATYLLAMNSFLAAGGDGFTPFAPGNLGTTGQVDMDGFIQYFEEHGELAPDLAKRSVAVTWVSEEDAVYAPGEEIAVDLAGLNWSVPGLPQGESVQVTLAGIDVGEAEIDQDWVDLGEDNDLRGRAEVRVNVPQEILWDAMFQPGLGAGFSAVGTPELTELQVPLVITEPTTGLEITLAVTVLAADVDAGAETHPDPTEPADTPSPSAPAAGGDAGAGQGPQAAPAGGLAQTGATVAVISLLAVLLLAVGAFLVIRQRRATALK